MYCQVVAERELVVVGPYNGLLITSDGHLVMKDLASTATELYRLRSTTPSAESWSSTTGRTAESRRSATKPPGRCIASGRTTTGTTSK